MGAREQRRPGIEAARSGIRDGTLRGAALLDVLHGWDLLERDRKVEELLGISTSPRDGELGPELIGYHASGIGAIEAIVRELAIREGDTFVDIGAGLGKVAMLVHLLTGARCVGLEIQEPLVQAARARAADLHLDGVWYVHGDARSALPEGSAYFLYLPFTGAALDAAVGRLEEIAEGRPIRVGTVGLDLDRFEWLRRLPSSDFWTAAYASTRSRPITRSGAPSGAARG